VLSRASVFVYLILAFTALADAQTTIFNIPSAETLQKASVNVEADFLTKPAKYSEGGYQTYGYRIAYGVTNKTEIGSNFYLTRSGDGSTADVEFSVKRNLYQNEKHAISVSAGAIAFVPLHDHLGDRTSVLAYGNVSRTVKQLGGMTATAGVYHVFYGLNDFGTRTGAMLGIVQPVKGRVSFVADWFSGHNRFGYASAGINVNITKRQYILAGYSFGNSGRGNNALAVYYGVTF